MKVTPTFIIALSFLLYMMVAIGLGMVEGYQEVPLTAILASFLHAFMLHVLVWYYARYACEDPRRIVSPVGFFIVVNLFYFGCTFLKYYRKTIYVELTTVLSERLIGSILVFVSLFLLLRWWSWWTSRHPDHSILALRRLGENKVFKVLILLGLVSCLFIYVLLIKNYLENAVEGIEMSRSVLISSWLAKSMLFPLFVATFYLQKGVIRNMCFFVCILMALVFALFLVSRSVLAILVLISIPCLFFRWRLKPNLANKIFIIMLGLPLVVFTFLVPLTNFVKKGISNKTDLVVTAGRAELSDFAISICLRDNRLDPYEFIINNLQWATLGTYIKKDKLVYIEDALLLANKWRSSDYRTGYTLDTTDYMDTLFSCGAMLGGYIGFVLFPIIWAAAFTLLIYKCSGLYRMAAQLCCVSYLVRIENAPWGLLVVWREFLVTTVMLYVLLKLVSLITVKLGIGETIELLWRQGDMAGAYSKSRD